MGRTFVPVVLLILSGFSGLGAGDADDDPAQANWIANYQTITGSLHGTTDADDWYRINLTAGDVIEVHLTVPGGADFDLGITNSTRSDWLDTSLGIDSSERVEITAPENDTFYILVSAFSGAGNYQLAVTIDEVFDFQETSGDDSVQVVMPVWETGMNWTGNTSQQMSLMTLAGASLYNQTQYLNIADLEVAYKTNWTRSIVGYTTMNGANVTHLNFSGFISAVGNISNQVLQNSTYGILDDFVVTASGEIWGDLYYNTSTLALARVDSHHRLNMSIRLENFENQSDPFDWFGSLWANLSVENDLFIDFDPALVLLNFPISQGQLWQINSTVDLWANTSVQGNVDLFVSNVLFQWLPVDPSIDWQLLNYAWSDQHHSNFQIEAALQAPGWLNMTTVNGILNGFGIDVLGVRTTPISGDAPPAADDFHWMDSGLPGEGQSYLYSPDDAAPSLSNIDSTGVETYSSDMQLVPRPEEHDPEPEVEDEDDESGRSVFGVFSTAGYIALAVIVVVLGVFFFTHRTSESRRLSGDELGPVFNPEAMEPSSAEDPLSHS